MGYLLKPKLRPFSYKFFNSVSIDGDFRTAIAGDGPALKRMLDGHRGSSATCA
jgi:hypothetical protein